MNQKFDVAIIGGGPAGIFAAYELAQKKPHLQVVMIEEIGRASCRERV